MATHPLQKKLQTLVNEWQVRLSLEHWKIKAEMRDDLEAAGRALTNTTHLVALIEVHNPDFAPKDLLEVKDFEVTIVHELLHVRQAFLTDALYTKKNSKNGVWDQVEQGIEFTAQALVAAKRGQKKFTE